MRVDSAQLNKGGPGKTSFARGFLCYVRLKYLWSLRICAFPGLPLY